MTDKEKMFYENQKKIHLLGGVSHLLIVNGKLIIRGGKKEKNVAEMKVMMIRVLAGQVKKKSSLLLMMMYVHNDKDEDQNFTAMKKPDYKKKICFC